MCWSGKNLRGRGPRHPEAADLSLPGGGGPARPDSGGLHLLVGRTVGRVTHSAQPAGQGRQAQHDQGVIAQLPDALPVRPLYSPPMAARLRGGLAVQAVGGHDDVVGYRPGRYASNACKAARTAGYVARLGWPLFSRIPCCRQRLMALRRGAGATTAHSRWRTAGTAEVEVTSPRPALTAPDGVPQGHLPLVQQLADTAGRYHNLVADDPMHQSRPAGARGVPPTPGSRTAHRRRAFGPSGTRR